MQRDERANSPYVLFKNKKGGGPRLHIDSAFLHKDARMKIYKIYCLKRAFTCVESALFLSS
jgi:hypothetical protein